jgi:hypothetical protein
VDNGTGEESAGCWVLAKYVLASHRVDSVGANDNIGRGGSAVLEMKRDWVLVAFFVYFDQTIPEVNAMRFDKLNQLIKEMGSVDGRAFDLMLVLDDFLV